MKALEARNRINSLMAQFVAEVKGATAMGQTDINHVAETVLIPLFQEVYDLKHLKDLNLERANYPGVDLGDAKKRVAIQITSTNDVAKVKKTLDRFMAHKLYEKYDRVIVYILTDKQSSYSGRGFDGIIGANFAFDKDDDIQDHTDILSIISRWQLPRLQRVLAILEANFGNGSSLVLQETPDDKAETLSLNLLPVFFPDTLYIADLGSDLQRAARELEGGQGSGKRFRRHPKRRPPSPRDRVTRFLHEQGLKFAVDWQYHAGQIVTFHDLEDDTLPLAKAIERGTVTTLHPAEYYDECESQENVFRSLLHRCLQQKLYSQNVLWQNEADLFIFAPEDKEEVRTEKWFGKKSNSRDVYTVVKKDPKKMKRRDDGREPNPILHHKHFAFDAKSFRIGDQWYFMLLPDWFHSSDSYKMSFYNADNVSWLKRHESNQSVHNHVRFLSYFLKQQKESTLFKQVYPYQFLSFKDLLSIGGAPTLRDSDWLPGEGKSKRARISAGESSEANLDLFKSQVSDDEDDE